MVKHLLFDLVVDFKWLWASGGRDLVEFLLVVVAAIGAGIVGFFIWHEALRLWGILQCIRGRHDWTDYMDMNIITFEDRVVGVRCKRHHCLHIQRFLEPSEIEGDETIPLREDTLGTHIPIAHQQMLRDYYHIRGLGNEIVRLEEDN